MSSIIENKGNHTKMRTVIVKKNHSAKKKKKKKILQYNCLFILILG